MDFDSVLPISTNRITGHISYAFRRKSSIRSLQSEIEQLKNEKHRLRHYVAEATRNGAEIDESVSSWLIEADKAIREAEELLQHRDEANLKNRCQISRKAKQKSRAIIRLCNDPTLGEISYPQPRQQVVEHLVYRSKLLFSRVLILGQIMDALRDPSLNVIGIYGVGGVGKTTLANEVFAQARDEELFDYVVMISVSQFPNLRRLQAEIAGFLGLKFDSEEVLRRASQLCERLKKAKSLVILDNVWQKLDLNAVGIPFRDEGQRCKLLVLSRSKDVLSSEMGSQKDFLVDALREEESLTLFRSIFPGDEGLEFRETAVRTAEKCAGLPLLIKLTSLQQKNTDFRAWHDMCRQLSEFENEDLPGRVRKVVESSFDNLPEKNLKSLFLLCALFAQSNIKVQHLLIQGMGLRLFPNITTIELARFKLYRMIRQLEEYGLLLDWDLDGHVKLHDVFRDVAISIASKCHKFFIGASENRLRDWKNEDCTGISISICNIQDLPANLQCPKAEFFLLSSEDLCLEIPDLFFEDLLNLKVAGFTGIRFANRFPSSLGFLHNLNTLCFHRCLLDSISVIGELRELEFLSFADSMIVELPREIEALAQLKLLDLTNCSKLQVIPSNVLSKLLLLEKLYMRNTYVQWDEEGNVSLDELEKLSELSYLELQIVNPELMPKLRSFCYRLPRYKIIIGREQGWCENYETSRMLKLIKFDAAIHLDDKLKLLLKRIEDLCLDKVSGMKSALNDLIAESFPQLRHLCIKNDYGIQHVIKSESFHYAFPVLESLCLDSLTNLEMICDCQLKNGSFRELQILKVSDCGKLKSLFSFSNSSFLWNLREIEVESCENIEAIVSEGSGKIDFTRLRSLKLKNLPHFKGFCKENKKTEKVELLFNDMIVFPNLTDLEVKKCKSLKYVFTISTVKWLPKLNRLDIINCEFFEEIIWYKRSEEAKIRGIDKIVFPELNCISLKNLRNLKRFSCGFPFEFPSLAELSIHKCPAMEHFASTISAKNTSSEDDELLFGENARLYNLDGKKFPRLAHLHIQNGHGIQSACKLNHFNNLESLYVEELRSLNARDCYRQKNLFSFSSAQYFTQLCEMEVQCCQMEAIIGGTSGDEILELTQLRSLKLKNLPHLTGFCELKEGTGEAVLLSDNMVSFPNLTSLVVEKCNGLKYVFTTSMVKCLVQLKKLEISNCKSVEAIIQSNKSEDEIIDLLEFRKLDTLSLCRLPNVKVFGCGYEIEFPLLRELSIECPAMEMFVSKTSGRDDNYSGDEYLFNELVTFPNLESMVLRNMDKIRYLWQGQIMLDGLLLKLKLLNIENCSRLSVVFPANTFSSFQELETLHLFGCNGMDEIFEFEENEVITEEFALRDVQVLDLASLKYVFPNTIAYSLLKLEMLEIQNCNVQVIIEEAKVEISNGITCSDDSSVQRVEMFQEMEVYTNEGVVDFPQLFSLKLKNLPHLRGFCNRHEQGFGLNVSFPSLKGLEISECENFKYVFTTTMVNCLMHLGKLEINNCDSVEEIVLSRQFDEIVSSEKIVFPKLEFLSLKVLPQLKTFNSRYSVEFQALKELSISSCPVLKNFVSKYLGDESDEYLFNEMVSFSKLERLNVCHNYSFTYLWGEQSTANDSFLNLKSLTIEYCSKLSIVFPSSICRRFQGLERLYVHCCSRVEEIYRYEGKHFEEQNTMKAFSLQDLEIWNLPSLKYIWRMDPPGASSFNYLQSVKVVSCKDLMFVFPKSIARRLLQLQHLKIANSHMEAIVGSTDFKESNIVFPHLIVLQLENIYRMRNLCKGPYTLKCPKLKQLAIYGCNQEMSFLSEVRSSKLCSFDQVTKLGSKVSAETSLSFFNKKHISNLEELALDDQGLELILSVYLGVEFPKLKKVTLRSLESESIPSLVGFLRQCSLDKLVFTENYLDEIFVLEEGEEFQKHLRLEHLDIVGDDSLKHILKKDSRFNPILEKLLTLSVEFCEYLINLAPTTASFRHLTSLNISVCSKMRNLVTASTAQTMTKLVELKVSECYMMEEIVENDGLRDSLISFNKLKCLGLHDLPTLNSFSSWNYNLSFPSLERVIVNKCFAMKNFCRGQVTTPKLKAVHFQNKLHRDGGLNDIIASQAKSRVTNQIRRPKRRKNVFGKATLRPS